MITKEKIEKAARENASKHFPMGSKEWWNEKKGFEVGAHYVLDHLCHLPLDELVLQLAEYVDEKLPERKEVQPCRRTKTT